MFIENAHNKYKKRKYTWKHKHIGDVKIVDGDADQTVNTITILCLIFFIIILITCLHLTVKREKFDSGQAAVHFCLTSDCIFARAARCYS